jgi:hypothetical protein
MNQGLAGPKRSGIEILRSALQDIAAIGIFLQNMESVSPERKSRQSHGHADRFFISSTDHG